MSQKGIGIMLVTILLFSCPVSTARADAKSRAETLAFLQEHHIDSVSQYAAWLKNNMHYEHDKNRDHWARPEETLRDRSGDCEDFAFLSAEVLRIFGYMPRVIAVGRGKEAHAICVFKFNNAYFAFDNTALNDTHQMSLDDMARFLGGKENAQYIVELSWEPAKKVRPIYLFDSAGKPRQAI